MPMLEAASDIDKKRLIELFPANRVRDKWSDLKGTKEDVCFTAIQRSSPQELVQFVSDNLSCCKQHVHILNCSAGNTPELPETLPGGERVRHDHGTSLYLVRTTYTVVLRNPLEETTLDFLWPIQIGIANGHMVVRFVSLEKNLSAYFDRPCYVPSRSIEEDTVLAIFRGTDLSATDIHKGIKTLWENGFMDSPRARYKKPMSVASEFMDEERGIREFNPELYDTLQDSVLLNTLFLTSEESKCGASAFSVDCSNGYLAFPRYSEPGGTDDVINKILELN